MGNLQVPNGGNGGIEVYGASTKINEEILSNYATRGEDAARLVIATLTESPYTPTIDGTRFEVEVSNVYRGGGEDMPDGPDTVVEARDALSEFLNAEVPGAKRLRLLALKTDYGKILKDLSPERKANSSQRGAFNEALVERVRRYNVAVSSPEQALMIVAGAPKWLELLKLTDDTPSYSGRTVSNEAVTADGRMVTTHSIRKSSLSTPWDVLPTNVRTRGGKAPGSGIVSTIERRVLDLRTKHTRR